ncbi:phage tail tip lysozyme [Lentilactobacillus senioris]|uniref:phage tail tip lysozyme n=1 Tax=Lentilactobacillus senioris TaxID=931534 RepID=UPI003D28348E
MAYDAIRQSMIGIGFKVDWDEYDKVSKRVDGLSKGTHKIKVSSDDKQLKKTAQTAKKTGESISRVGHEASQSSKQVSNATKKMESGYKQAGSSASQFGNKAKQAVSKSRSGLGSATAETKKLGAGYSHAASQADKLSRSGRRAKSSLKGIDSSSFIRVASGIGKASQKMGFFTTQTKKAKDSVFSMHHIMKTTFGAMSSYVGFSAIGNGIKSIIGEIDDSSKAWQTFQGNMQANNHSKSFISKTQGDLQQFAQQTIYSASDMANTFAQLDAVGTKHTESLVKGLGGLASSAEDPAQAMSSLSTQFTQMASLPKVQYADLKIMMQQAPAGVAAIAKSIGMTEGQMIKAVHAGTLSTKEFMNGVAKAGNSKQYQKMATQYKTVGQAADGLRETIGNKLLKTYQSASKVGIKAISSITDALGNIKQKDIDKMAAPALKSVSHFVDYMIKNGPTFADIGKSVFSIGGSFAKGAWSVIADTIGLLAGHLPGANKGLKGVAKNLNDISKHKKGIETVGKIVVGFLAVRKATQFAAALGSVATNLGIIQKTKLPSGGTSLSFGKTATGVAAGATALDMGLTIYDGFQKGFNTKGGTKDAWSAGGEGIGAAIGSAFGPAGTFIGGQIGKKIGSAFGDYLYTHKVFKNWTQSKPEKGDSKGTTRIGKGDKQRGVLANGDSVYKTKNGTYKIYDKDTGNFVRNSKKDPLKQNQAKNNADKYNNGRNSILDPKSSKPAKGGGTSLANSTVGKLFTGKLKMPKWNIGKWWSDTLKGFRPKQSLLNKFKNIKFNNPFKNFHPIKWFKNSIKGFNPKKTISKWFKGIKIPNPFKNFHPIKWFQKTLKGFHPIKSIQGFFKGIKIPNPFAKFHPIKWFNKTLRGFHPIKTIRNFFKGIKIPNPFANFHPVKWFKNTLKDFHPVKWIKDKFSGLKSWFSDLWKGMFSSVTGFFDKIGDKISDLKSIPGKILDKIKGHAKGGPINHPEIAMVGEEGYEVVTNKKHGTRIVGANGPEITALRGGDHVYPHRDSKKMLGSGLGAGKTLAGYAKGTDKLSPSAYGKQWITGVHVVTTKGKSSKNQIISKEARALLGKDYGKKKDKKDSKKLSKSSKSKSSSKKSSSKKKSTKKSSSSTAGVMSAKQLRQLSKESKSIWNSIYTNTRSRTKAIASTIKKNYASGVKSAVKSLKALSKASVKMPKLKMTGFGKKFKAPTINKKSVNSFVSSINKMNRSVKSLKSTNNSSWSNVASATGKYVDRIKRKVKSGYSGSTDNAYTEIRNFDKQNSSVWRDVYTDTSGYLTKIRKVTGSRMNNVGDFLSSALKNIRKDWRSNWNSVAADFKSIFGRLDNYAHSGMSKAIGQLNKGFSSIDSALGQFGGSKQVLKPIHYAKGSNGPVNSDHFAMVNDATSGPRQEAIISPNGTYRLPKGNNVITPIRKGETVLNGSDLQTAQVAGVIPRYAKGKKSKDTLNKILDKNSKDGSKTYDAQMDNGFKLSKGLSALSSGITRLVKSGSAKVGKPWSNTAWSTLSDARDSGAAGGNWLHNPGLIETDGFNSGRKGGIHDGVDFSGSVGSAIKAVHGGKVIRVGYPPSAGWGAVGHSIVVKSDDGKQVIYQEYGMAKNAKVSVGDIIKPGQTVATLGHNNVGTPPHVHIGVSDGSVWDHGGSSHNRWHDITKMHGKSDGTSGFTKDKSKSKNSGLTKYVKKQLKGQIKWISKNLAEDDIGSLSLSGSLSSRARSLAAALKKLYPSANLGGIAGILGNWMQESRLDPSAINASDHGSGLAQWTAIRETRMRNWLKNHHYKWNDAAGQLDWALHEPGMSGEFKRVLRMKNPVAAARAFFAGWESGGAMDATGGTRLSNAKSAYNAIKKREKGGSVSGNQPYIVGEKGWEIFQPSTSGKIIPHTKAKQIAQDNRVGTPKPKTIKGGKQNVSINVDMNITMDGNGGGSSKSEIKKTASQLADALFDALSDRIKGGQVDFGN